MCISCGLWQQCLRCGWRNCHRGEAQRFYVHWGNRGSEWIVLLESNWKTFNLNAGNIFFFHTISTVRSNAPFSAAKLIRWNGSRCRLWQVLWTEHLITTTNSSNGGQISWAKSCASIWAGMLPPSTNTSNCTSTLSKTDILLLPSRNSPQLLVWFRCAGLASP